MAGDPFRKVRPGQRLNIPAAAYNAFVDAAQMTRGMRSAAGVPQWRHGVLVTVQNITEADQDRFSVMGINGPIFTPSENLHEFCDYVGLKVTTPASAHRSRFVILAEPIAAGGVGMATVYGPTVVKLDIASDEQGYGFGDVWDTRSDVLKPMQQNASAMVLWRESGVGEKWAIVRLSNPHSVYL